MVEQTIPVPVQFLPGRTPAQLLALARTGLAEAADANPDGLRYAVAHLAALRAAAAMVAARSQPYRFGRLRVTPVWELLPMVAPELGEWASYFATGVNKRAAAETGIPRVVDAREADNLVQAAEQFVGVVETQIGVSHE